MYVCRLCVYLHQLACGKKPTDIEAYTELKHICRPTSEDQSLRARAYTRIRAAFCLQLPLFANEIQQNAPRRNRTRQKGLRERNSPFCTLSQNGYGDSAAKPSGVRRALAAERGRSQRQVCTPSGGSSGGCVCLGEPRVQRTFVEPAQPARSACQPSSAQLSQPSQLGVPAQLNPAEPAQPAQHASPARPSRASPASPGCQPSSHI